MKITILGTGTSQGVPVIGCKCHTCTSPWKQDKRTRSSAIITKGDFSLLIDTSPDLRAQLLINNITDIDAVLYTHEHNDHVVGFDDLRPITLFLNKDVEVYGEKRVLDDIIRKYQYIFNKSYPGALVAIPTEITEDSNIQVGPFLVKPIRVIHGNLPILGYRIDNFAYITDAKRIAPKEMDKLKNLDVLILNALKHSSHSTHLSLEEANAIVKELKPKQTYYTHIGHQMGRHFTINATLPSNIQLAVDNQTIELA